MDTDRKTDTQPDINQPANNKNRGRRKASRITGRQTSEIGQLLIHWVSQKTED